MRVADFDFDLPDARIAQTPAPRGESRLLVVDRAARRWHEARVRDLPSLLAPGDLVVGNDTRVYPARLIGRRDPSGGAAECLLLERVDDAHWHALVHPGQKLKPGARLLFEDAARAPGVRLRAEILERRFHGRRLIRLEAEAEAEAKAEAEADAGAAGAHLDVDAAIDAIGHVPLPPYIHRADTDEDRRAYQTVFARARGSVAAPTAGLHLDEALLSSLDAAGIGWTTVTLHVGYGTFKPVRSETVEAHRVDPERYEIPAEAAGRIRRAREAGRRVVAVGTTTTRALETAARDDGTVAPGAGTTELFIHPGYRFRVTGGLLTNFHLPRSSLLMLVAAFGGRDLILAAYRHAVDARFRFYSYGDAMLIL